MGLWLYLLGSSAKSTGETVSSEVVESLIAVMRANAA